MNMYIYIYMQFSFAMFFFENLEGTCIYIICMKEQPLTTDIFGIQWIYHWHLFMLLCIYIYSWVYLVFFFVI